MLQKLYNNKFIDLDINYDEYPNQTNIIIHNISSRVHILVTTNQGIDEWIDANRDAIEDNGGEDVLYIDSNTVIASHGRTRPIPGTSTRFMDEVVCHIITDAYDCRISY